MGIENSWVSKWKGNLPSVGRNIASGARSAAKSIMKRKGWGSLGLGAALGAGAGIYAGNAYNSNQYGYEGELQGISSSPSGGISPELQFSTEGLTFALHRNNKAMRRRYQ